MATGSEAAHDLCLKPQSPGKVRVNLEIERGHGQKYYAEMASENKMALTQRPCLNFKFASMASARRHATATPSS